MEPFYPRKVRLYTCKVLGERNGNRGSGGNTIKTAHLPVELITSHWGQNVHHQKDYKQKCGRGCGERGGSCTVGGNVNCCMPSFSSNPRGCLPSSLASNLSFWAKSTELNLLLSLKKNFIVVRLEGISNSMDRSKIHICNNSHKRLNCMYPLVQSQQTIANGTDLAQCLFWLAYKQTMIFYFKSKHHRTLDSL